MALYPLLRQYSLRGAQRLRTWATPCHSELWRYILAAFRAVRGALLFVRRSQHSGAILDAGVSYALICATSD